MNREDKAIAQMRGLYGRPVLGAGPAEGFDPMEGISDADPCAVIGIDRTGCVHVDRMATAEYLRDLGYRYIEGTVCRFGNGRFVPADQTELREVISDAPALVGQRMIVGRGIVNDIISYWMGIANPARMGGERDRWLIPFSNCLYDVGSAKPLPFSMDAETSGGVTVPYDPAVARRPGPASEMRALYEDIAGGAEECDALMLAIGCTVCSSETDPPAMFILTGPEGTGKTAVLKAVEALAGKPWTSRVPPERFGMVSGRDLMRGRRANICDMSGTKKQVVISDGNALGTILEGEEIPRAGPRAEFRNRARVWIATNPMPDLSKLSRELVSRICLFRFENSQDGRDIYDRMLSEEGLIWLAYEALKAYVLFKWSGADRFPVPESMSAAMSGCGAGDMFLAFLCEAADTDNPAFIREWLNKRSVSEVHDGYVAYTAMMGIAAPMRRYQFRDRVDSEFAMHTETFKIRVNGEYRNRLVFVKNRGRPSRSVFPSMDDAVYTPRDKSKAEAKQDAPADSRDAEQGVHSI